MPKKQYSAFSPFRMIGDKSFADALENLCDENNISADLETGKGMGAAFWTYSYGGHRGSVDGVKSIFMHGGDDFTSSDDMKKKMWNLGSVKVAAGENRLFVYRDGEDYPRRVSWNSETRVMDIGERLDQIPDPPRSFLLRIKQLLNSINSNWFSSECQEYQSKLEGQNRLKEFFRENAEARAAARLNPAPAEPEAAPENAAPEKSGTEREMKTLKSFLTPQKLGFEVSEADAAAAQNVLDHEGDSKDALFESPALGGGKYDDFVRSICGFARQSKANRDRLTAMAENGAMNRLYEKLGAPHDRGRSADLEEALNSLLPQGELGVSAGGGNLIGEQQTELESVYKI